MVNSNYLSRREILGSAVLASFSTIPGAKAQKQKMPNQKSRPVLFDGATILLQGDSITDAGRNKKKPEPNKQRSFGKGYAWMAAASLLIENPNSNLSFHNRGISGNKVHQLAQRWKKDCIALKPDILSILIGVNDFWHGLNGRYEGNVETFEVDYRSLLEDTLLALPKIRLIICEPFVLNCGVVTDEWFPQFREYQAVVQKLALEFDAVFVDFQKLFDQAIEHASPEHWAGDGVHPTPHGASLMAHYWIQKAKG